MKFSIKDSVIVLFISALIALIVTLIYIKLPPFYITSFNYSIVPTFEQNELEYNYNGFYQSQTAQQLVNTLSLFAASGDFKQTLQNDLNTNVVYLLSNTRGNSILSLRIVTFNKPNISKTNELVQIRLQEALNSTIPENLEIQLKSLENFNHTYTGALSAFKFYNIVFATTIVFSTLFILLKQYYSQDKN